MEINYTELRESFVRTSLDMLDGCESALISAESSNTFDVTAFLRSIHTIKGNAGIFELNRLIALCHAVETAVQPFQDASAPGEKLTDDLLRALDTMKALVRNSEQGESANLSKEAGEIAARLEGVDNVATEKTKPKLEDSEKIHTAGNIRLPQKYIDFAQSRGKNLYFILVDFSAQKSSTLKNLHDILSDLHQRGELLSFGDLSDKLKGEGSPAYYLVVAAAENMESYLSGKGLVPQLVRTVFTVKTQTAEPAQVTAIETPQADTHLKVRTELLTALIDVTGEIVLTRNSMLRRIEILKESSLQSSGKKLSHLVSSLQDLVMRTRLQPIKVLLQRLPRLVRDTALATGKKVQLFIDDAGIEIDKIIYDQIDESLTHLIRNAVDHGIETPAERLAAGKNETGRIDLKVAMQAGSILITVKDDGRGLDYDAIRRKGEERNLISPTEAHNLDEPALANLIFLPGFSTKNAVSTISGRGVGMDVVRTCVTRVGGAVDISADYRAGTEFILRIPQTLSILTCLIIEVGGKRLALPRQHIVELVVHDENRMRRTAKSAMVLLRDELIPVVEAAKMLGLGMTDPTHHVVVRTERNRFALTVDKVLDTEEVVVKPLPVKLKNEQFFSGAAVMGDGEIALILDLHAVVRSSHLEAEEHAAENRGRAEIAEGSVTTDTGTHILVEVLGRQILISTRKIPRIEKIAAAKIELNAGRASFVYQNENVPLISWKEITGHEFGEIIESGNRNLYAVIFRDGETPYAAITTGLFDIVSKLESPVTPIAGVAGVTGETVIKGRSALIVEPLAAHAAALQGVNHV